MSLNFNQYATEGNTFIKNYAEAMSMENERDKAGRILTSVLHALRDIISTEESLQFIAQLPMFVKAVYVNGWSIKKKKVKARNMVDFIDLVRKHDGPAATNDFEYNDKVAEDHIRNTFKFLKKHVSKGEMEDIRDGLPKDLKNLIATYIEI